MLILHTPPSKVEEKILRSFCSPPDGEARLLGGGCNFPLNSRLISFAARNFQFFAGQNGQVQRNVGRRPINSAL
jgi:hypothetical protein